MADELREFKEKLQQLFPNAKPLGDHGSDLLLEGSNPELQQWIKSMGTNVGVNITSDGNLSISFPQELQKDGKQTSYSDAFPEKYTHLAFPNGLNVRVLQGGDGKPIMPETLKKELDRRELVEDIYRTVKEQRDEYRLLYEYEDHKVLASFSDCLYADAKSVRLIGPDGRASDFNMPQKDTEQGKTGDHLYLHDMNVTILSPDGSATVVPLHEKPENLPESFAWARESFGKLATEWDKIAAGEERALLDNFRQRGGILSLMQRNADMQKFSNAVNGEQKETRDDRFDITAVTGTSFQEDDGSRIAENTDFFIGLSTERIPTVLLHELTHLADHGISNSLFFQTCFQLDKGRGGQIIPDLIRKMEEAIEYSSYKKDDIPGELICRLNEARHADPEQFKKECPLLDAFYSKVFYPALTAQTIAVNPDERIGSQEAADVLGNWRLLSDEITPLTSWNASELINDQHIEEMLINLSTETDPQKRAEIRSSLNSALDKNPYVQLIYQTMDKFHQEMIDLQEKTKLEHRQSWKNHGILFGPDGVNYWVPTDDNGRLIIPEYLQHRYQDANNPSNDDALQATHGREAASVRDPTVQKGNVDRDQPNPQPHPTSYHDMLSGASNMGKGQMGETSMDKHNGLDYRNVGGKDHQGPAPEPARPTNPLEAEKQRKRDEIMKQREYEAQLAAKRHHSL
ncbi:MAG: hypothetical protein IKS41_01420 [Alphaproteobacteria bacterium]|nr:hypothetical protein [Alphaproteobacteria bacterium]